MSNILAAIKNSVLIILGLLAFPLAAKTCDAQDAYKIFFLNGIMTSPTSAEIGREKIREQFGDTHRGRRIVYSQLFNATDGLILDIAESAKQRYPALDFKLADLMQLLQGQQTDNSSISMKQAVAAGFSDAARNMSQRQIETSKNIELLRMSVFNEGYRTLIIAHSQGTLFANEAYSGIARNDELENRIGALGIYGLAPAADFITPAVTAESSTYLKNTLDILARLNIGARPNKVVRSQYESYAVLDALPITATAQNVLAAYEAYQMHLLDAYLSDEHGLRQVFLKGVFDKLDSIEDPYPPCETEPPLPPVVSGFQPYLPATLAGIRLSPTPCKRQVSVPGRLPYLETYPNSALTLGTDGRYAGTGCFIDFEGSDKRDYGYAMFGQECLRLGKEICVQALTTDGVNVAYHPATSRQSFQIPFLTSYFVPNSAPPVYQNQDVTAYFPTLEVDVASRLRGWFEKISGKQCRFTDSNNVLQENYRYVVSGTKIAFVGPSGIVASAESNEIAGHDYTEQFTDNGGPGYMRIFGKHPADTNGNYWLSINFTVNINAAAAMTSFNGEAYLRNAQGQIVLTRCEAPS